MTENLHSLIIHEVKDFEIKLTDQDYETLKITINPELYEELRLARSIQDEALRQIDILTNKVNEYEKANWNAVVEITEVRKKLDIAVEALKRYHKYMINGVLYADEALYELDELIEDEE